jgi:FkbM family methyltransferase
MHYNYVDIGTSNFHTSADFALDDPSINVLLVEPLDFYLNFFKTDDFEGKDNIKLCNSAISDIEGTSIIYFLSEEFIEKTFPMPDKSWLKGCNKLDKPHHFVLAELENLSIDPNVINQRTVKKITFDTLCNEFNITSIGRLKIDTEGCESLMLPSIIKKIKNGMMIQSLFIENNDNSDHIEMEKLFMEFDRLNYTRINHPHDMELILK